MQVGHALGHCPSEKLETLGPALLLRAELSPTPLLDIIRLFPESQRAAITDPEVWLRLRQSAHPEF